jgi:hypothetical protein
VVTAQVGEGEPGGDMQLEYTVFCRLGYLHGGRVRGRCVAQSNY